MSTGTGEDQGTTRADWRSSSPGSGRRSARHRWQEGGRDRHSVDRGRRKIVVGGIALLAVLGGMLGLFAWSVAFRPVRTPFVAIGAPAYGDPFPPNAWCREDLDRLAVLHCETIDFTDLSAAWQTSKLGLRSLERELENVAPTARRCGAAIVYLSMHGAVDGEGRPCLVPPGASPVNARTWLPVEEVLSRLDAFGRRESATVLLVLDSGRIDVDWNLGVLANEFAGQLVELTERKPMPHVVVLNAAGIDEVAQASAELRGSAFGVQFQRGLAGAADGAGFGNEDGRVSIHELHGYLVREVDAWARRNRGTTQRPLLLPAEAEDIVVAWSLGASNRGSATPETPADPSTTATVTSTELDRLWTAYERVPSSVAERIDPIAWGAVRRLLRRVEVTSVAGRDYAEAARRDYAELLLQLERTASAFDKNDVIPANGGTTKGVRPHAGALTVAREWNLLSPASQLLPKSMPAHTLALAERLGTVDHADAGRAVGMLAGYYSGDQPWSSVREQLVTVLGPRSFAETEFPQLLEFALVDRPWRLSKIVDVRSRAESLAAPTDERSLVWLVPPQNAADALRRRAEDRVFAGAVDESDWARVALAYDRAAERATAAERALACLDRAAARLPLYAARLAAPRRVVRRPASEVPMVVDELRDLTTDVRELQRLVQGGGATTNEADSRGEAPPFANLATKVERALDRMQDDLTAEYGRLEALVAELSAVESPNAEQLTRTSTAIADARLVLDVPLLPVAKPGSSGAARRGALRSGAGQLRRLLAETSAGVPVEALGDLAPTGEGFATLTAAHWMEHPAEVVLAFPRDGSAQAETSRDVSPATEGGNGEADWWRAGQRVRERLRDVPDRVQRSTTGPAGTVADVRALHRAGAEAVRVAAPFWFPRPEIDPVRRLRAFDLQALLQWNAGRVVDDFWGPAGSGSRSFFATAATAYVDGLGEFGQDSPVLHTELERLRTRLARRESAAGTGLVVAASDVVVLDPAAGDDVVVSVAAESSAENGGLPSGIATIGVLNDAGPIARTTMSLPIPAVTAGEPFRTTITKHLGLDDLPEGKPLFVAELKFRGHRFAGDFLFEPVDGASTVFEPRTFDTSTVRLSSGQRTPLSVVFVLDCSQSMRRDSELETTDTRVPSKLDVARIALGNMLAELAPRDDVEVGVVLFGHRAGWDPETRGLVQYDRRYARIDLVPADLQPFEDVEVVLPPGRFDVAIAASTAELLGTVDPWGESPLYLAVRTAATALETSERGAERVVIVLTDGTNNQFAPTPAQRVDLPDVLRSLDGRGIRVNVVGFGIPEAEKRRAQREFERLGRYDVRPARATALVESIREQLGPRNYTVQAESVPLGTARPITVTNPRPITSSVAFEGHVADLELWGGEFVELSRSPVDGRLVTRPPLGVGIRVPLVKGERVPRAPDADADADGPAPGDSNPPRTVLVHAPVLEEGRATFAFTFLRDDGAFSRRPRVTRFEVTPIDARGRRSEVEYVFVDPSWVPGRSHPRLESVADRWPKDAIRAEIRGWASFDAIPPDATLELRAGDRNEFGRDHRIPTQPGVTFRVSTSRLPRGQLDVYERSTGAGPAAGRLSFAVRPAEGVTKVIRQFDHVHGIVTHTFQFAPGAVPAGAKVELDVLGAATLRRRAASLERPIEVDVTATSEVVRPTTGPRTP